MKRAIVEAREITSLAALARGKVVLRVVLDDGAVKVWSGSEDDRLPVALLDDGQWEAFRCPTVSHSVLDEDSGWESSSSAVWTPLPYVIEGRIER